MPVISRFLGIAIYMYWNDHNPPHFHAIWNEHEVVINIETGDILAGEIPKIKLKSIQNWCKINKLALLNNWELARQEKPLLKIEGLDG